MFFFTPVIVKHMEKNLNIMKPRYSKQILPFPQVALRYLEGPH